jgi:hypothetical protein
VAAGGTVKVASGTDIGLGAAERRLLARMPLHAITSVHSEAGLGERLLNFGSVRTTVQSSP